MAFSFPRRDARALFFPTVHIHDGTVHAEATFDHALYCQPDPLVGETFGWEKAERIADVVDVARTRGIVDAEAPCYRKVLLGTYRNADVDLVPPEGLALASLRRIGRCFELRVRARSAYDDSPRDDRATRWRDSARTHADAIGTLLEGELAKLASAHADDWGLCPYDESLAECSFNANTVFRTALVEERGMLRQLEATSGPLRVLFVVSNDRIEPQHMWLSFADVPTPGKLTAIKQELRSALDRAPI